MRILLGSCLPIFFIALVFNIVSSTFKPTSDLINISAPRALNSHASVAMDSPVEVLTQHNDNERTGANLQEFELNTSNVNANQFGKLFSRSVDGYLYAQPLYARDILVAGVTRNIVYLATEHNSVYAFDADDSTAINPIWQVNLGPSVPSSDLAPGYHDLIPEIGITGTPVIDKPSGTIYVVAKTKDDNSYHQSLHALDLSTGDEKFGGPVEITASIAGTGAGSVEGEVSFDPLLELNRPALLFLNGVVYIAFGSHGDITPFHGWVLGYEASTLDQVAVHNTSPDGDDGAIWQGGQGLTADSANNIYYITGNGLFDVDQGGRDYGDSIVKLSTASGLAVVDFFTPYNQQTLSGDLQSLIKPNRFAPDSLADQDLGAGGPLLLPGTNLLVGCGKDGRVRLLDTNNLGHFHPDHNADLQEFQATSWVFFGAPIYWSSPINGPQIYMWGTGDYLKSFKLSDGLFNTSPTSQSTIQVYPGYSNSVPLSISANGSEPGSGIVWAACALGNSNGETVAGILRAFNADDLSKELWDSKQNEARDDVGSYAKFCPSTVANGKVYVPTFSGQLQVYGLLPEISPTDYAFAANGGSGAVEVTAPTGIAWTAVSNDAFITIDSGSSGAGNGTVNYSVAVSTGPARVGTMTIAGHTFTVTQDSGCSFTLSSMNQNFVAAGGMNSVDVVATAGCAWTAVSDDGFITIDSGSNGSGNGTVNYSVGANTGPARAGTMTIAGLTFTVTQDSGCTFTLGRDHQSFPGGGGSGSVNVTALDAACTWTANTNATYIHVTAGSSGAGNGVVEYSLDANPDASIRSDLIIIAGQPFAVYQGVDFLDVPANDPFYDDIGKLSARGVTVGCTNGNYCPDDPVTREQMAAFILRAKGEFNPPPPATQRFTDVTPENIFYHFIDRLAELQITLGCTPDHLMYCPSETVKREQMAAFLLRGLGEFNPPTPATQRFNDVPSSNVFYNFIDRLAVLQITMGCTPDHTLYCPNDSVTRAQMAAFLVRAFNL